MKKENTSIRLRKLMSERGLRQVDILNAVKPYCIKYDVKMNKSDISQYVSGKTEPGQDKLFVLALALNVSEAFLMGYEVDDVPLTKKDERDIKNDLDSLMNKLSNGELGPAAYDGEEIPEDDQELFAGQLELMLRKLKVINKEKYSPNKNKDKK